MRFHLALILLALWARSARAIEPADYKYPYPDPYLATATLAILTDDGATSAAQSTILRVPGLRGRNNLPSLQGRGDVSLALYRQNRAAPLIFILPGLGSSPYFGIAPYLANLFHREGFHVVVLPSPMGWNFALSASRSGAPGYAPDDARDLYEVMQKTLKLLRDRHSVRTTAIHFMGVSLGALEGAHLSVIDADEGKIGIAKYLLVNPPVDLAYAVSKIDEWKALDRKLGKEKSLQIISNALAIIDSFAKVKRDDPEVFEQLAKKFAAFKREEMQFLFAENLQSQLAELVYVTQVINDQKVLTSPKNDKRKRLDEAKSFTFTDYDRKIALPLWQRQKGDLQAEPQSFVQRGSLASIYDRLRDNPKVHIIHNADDFFAEKSSIEALKEALGDQVMLYPRGGHLGNLWYPENKEYVLKYFQARR
jgi:predicted alpha/beta-fold hydrolase